MPSKIDGVVFGFTSVRFHIDELALSEVDIVEGGDGGRLFSLAPPSKFLSEFDSEVDIVEGGGLGAFELATEDALWLDVVEFVGGSSMEGLLAQFPVREGQRPSAVFDIV